jgi:hypothetical protein
MATGWGRRLRTEMQKYAVNASPAASPTTPHAALSTANCGDDGAANAEPTSTGGYAAQPITWTAPTLPANDASAVAANSASFSFGNGSPASGPSSAAYSTGATNLTHIGVWNHLTTRTEAVYLGRAAIAVPQAVNSAGITLTVAIAGLTMGCISA